MAVRGMRIMRDAVAVAVAAAILVATVACGGGDSPARTGSADEPAAALGSVAVFTPSQGLTLSQRTPLNTWKPLVDRIAATLRQEGYDDEAISTHTSDSLDQQSREVQDYVVSRLAQSSAEDNPNGTSRTVGTKSGTTDGRTTLVVAPAGANDAILRQYGEYVQRDIRAETANGEHDDATAQAIGRLRSALLLAQDSGIRVVLLSDTVEGFVPDAFVRMSTARQIGAMQARELVSKLALDTAVADNPKNLEVLLPADPADDDTDARSDDAAFCREAFAGIWDVLQPYVERGVAVSPSGTLTAGTTVEDWTSLTVDATSDDSIAAALSDRLGMSDRKQPHTDIDGIIAMNDYVASGVVKRLDSLGYVGSSADVNPSISLADIMGNIMGKHDLDKRPVPEPAHRPDPGSLDGQAIETRNSQWPIITGYAGYLELMPHIVDGKVWMTGMENRNAIADDIATLVKRFGQDRSLDGWKRVTTETMQEEKVPVIHEDLLAVSASTLKSTLIDPGYISLADAGL